MLDERDLQAIKELFNSMEARFDKKLETHDEQMRRYIDMLMENEVRPSFKLLAEGHTTLLQTLAPKNRVDELAEEVSLLKSVVAAMNREISELKKAI